MWDLHFLKPLGWRYLSQTQDANTRSCGLTTPSPLLLSLRYDKKLRSLALSRPPGQSHHLGSSHWLPEGSADPRPRGTGATPPADLGAFQASPLGIRSAWPRAVSPHEDQRGSLCPGPGHRSRSSQHPTSLLAEMWSPGPTSVCRSHPPGSSPCSPV